MAKLTIKFVPDFLEMLNKDPEGIQSTVRQSSHDAF